MTTVGTSRTGTGAGHCQTIVWLARWMRQSCSCDWRRMWWWWWCCYWWWLWCSYLHRLSIHCSYCQKRNCSGFVMKLDSNSKIERRHSFFYPLNICCILYIKRERCLSNIHHYMTEILNKIKIRLQHMDLINLVEAL